MLRKVNGRLERRGEDGVWRPLEEQDAAQPGSAATGIGEEVDALIQARAGAEADTLDETASHTLEKYLRTRSPEKSYGSNDRVTEEVEAGETDRGSLDIGEIPGLLHGEGRHSTAQQSRLQKLRQRAKDKKGGSRITARVRKPREMVVPATVAEVSGPDAQGSRLDRSGSRRSVPVRETPTLLEDRPQWVKDLFEAHFRSELAYTLRRLPSGKDGKNRMKLSRQDYAIGWLVLLDKAREDPGILRIRNGVGG